MGYLTAVLRLGLAASFVLLVQGTPDLDFSPLRNGLRVPNGEDRLWEVGDDFNELEDDYYRYPYDWAMQRIPPLELVTLRGKKEMIDPYGDSINSFDNINLLNDENDLQNYQEVYKRPGYVGIRGKRYPNSGVMGARGKKAFYNTINGDKRKTLGFLKARGKGREYLDEKRAFGQFKEFGTPGKKQQNFYSQFFAMRGKRQAPGIEKQFTDGRGNQDIRNILQPLEDVLSNIDSHETGIFDETSLDDQLKQEIKGLETAKKTIHSDAVNN